MTTKDKIINKVILPTSYVLTWVVIYFLPRRMFNVGGDNGAESWILFGVFFFGLPLLLRLIGTRLLFLKKKKIGFYNFNLTKTAHEKE